MAVLRGDDVMVITSHGYLSDHISCIVMSIQLSLHLPSQAVDREWYLIYSTFKHGISLRTMYRNMTIFDNEDSPVILVIRDDCGKVKS